MPSKKGEKKKATRASHFKGKVFFKNYLDLIVSSGEIKKLIKRRAEELNVSLYNVAQEADISWDTFKKNYLQADEPYCSPSLRQEHIIKVLEILGVQIRVQLIEEPLENVDVKYLQEKEFEHAGTRRKRDRENQAFDERYS